MTDDELDFAARKYSHRFLWVGFLDSGALAVAGPDRQLLTIIDQPVNAHEPLWHLLQEAFLKPLPIYSPEPPRLRDLDELDLEINL